MSWLALLGGLVLLVAGAELLVRGAAGLAARVGLSALVIGLTVVAFGTSAPEIAVSLDATFTGRSAIAVGNVVGSNVFNVLFILGASALVAPLVVSRQILRTDVPILIGVSVLAWVMTLDGRLSRFDGALLLLGFVAYTTFTVREGLRQSAKEPEVARPGWPWPVQALVVLAGLALLVLGARWFVAGAVDVARLLGWSETVIGLTIVAAGTSMPEVATSLLAAFRGERDIAVGNVIGSNTFNLLGVLGLSAALAPAGLPVGAAMIAFDLPVMIAVALACLPIFFSGHLIARWEGALFLAYYVAYTAWLLLAAQQHAATAAYGKLMVSFVLPLTAVTLGVVAWREWRARHGAP